MRDKTHFLVGGVVAAGVLWFGLAAGVFGQISVQPASPPPETVLAGEHSHITSITYHFDLMVLKWWEERWRVEEDRCVRLPGPATFWAIDFKDLSLTVANGVGKLALDEEDDDVGRVADLNVIRVFLTNKIIPGVDPRHPPILSTVTVDTVNRKMLMVEDDGTVHRFLDDETVDGEELRPDRVEVLKEFIRSLVTYCAESVEWFNSKKVRL